MMSFFSYLNGVRAVVLIPARVCVATVVSLSLSLAFNSNDRLSKKSLSLSLKFLFSFFAAVSPPCVANQTKDQEPAKDQKSKVKGDPQSKIQSRRIGHKKRGEH